MDGSDDPYEAFQYLALIYSISGDESVYALARTMWDAITWQWTQYGQIEREFDRYYDWMHHGEANLFRYFFGLTKPESLVDRQRADRFARMYTGEDQLAPNYDAELGIIRAPQFGSVGPRLMVTAEDLDTHRGVLDGYHPPFEDLSTVPFPASSTPWNDDAVFAEIIEKMNQRTTRGDLPLKLNATGQMTHAFLYSCDESLRTWVTEYIARWRARADDNGGIVPDNLGLSGEVGEYLDGKWWGGHYGWRWPHGFMTIIEPAVNAGINGLLLTGDSSHLDLARQQSDVNFAVGHDEGRTWMVPQKHFDSGWTDYQPASPFHAIHVWARTLGVADQERVERARHGQDWSEVRYPVVISHGGLQHATVRYYDGTLRRPGLSDAVTALVHSIGPDFVELEIVNLDLVSPRWVVVQAGSFDEHRFVDASVGGGTPDPVDGRWVEVELGPGAGSRIRLSMERYAQTPSYETPWSRREDWDPIIRPRSTES